MTIPRASLCLRNTLIVLAAFSVVAATPSAPEKWTVDPAHSRIGFSVTHFFTPVEGRFDDYSVDLWYDRQDPENSRVSVEIQVTSVNTSTPRRDSDLRSGNFFAAEEHPTITFHSTSVTKSGDTLLARGPLTIKGVTKEITLPIEVLGVRDIPSEMRPMVSGATAIASFTATLIIDRRDFGVGVGNWAATLVVGGEITIDISLEAALR